MGEQNKVIEIMIPRINGNIDVSTIKDEEKEESKVFIDGKPVIFKPKVVSVEEYFKHHYDMDIHNNKTEDVTNFANTFSSLSKHEEEKKCDNPKQSTKVEQWKAFSKIMEKYIEDTTNDKYGDSKNDLISITNEPRIYVWSVLKYVFRMWKKVGKLNDVFKIAHCIQIAYTLANGNLESLGITNEKST